MSPSDESRGMNVGESKQVGHARGHQVKVEAVLTDGQGSSAFCLLAIVWCPPLPLLQHVSRVFWSWLCGREDGEKAEDLLCCLH